MVIFSLKKSNFLFKNKYWLQRAKEIVPEKRTTITLQYMNNFFNKNRKHMFFQNLINKKCTVLIWKKKMFKLIYSQVQMNSITKKKKTDISQFSRQMEVTYKRFSLSRCYCDSV